MGNYVTKIWYGPSDSNLDPIISVNTPDAIDNAIVPKERIYGWKRDNIDTTDVYHHFDYYTFMTTPVVDLRSAFPPVHNQLPINGTASAVASLYEFESCGPCKTNRQFVYYDEKNPGIAIRDAIQMFNKSRGTEKRCERLAQDIDYLRQCLCEGIPFAFGFSVYESFELMSPSGIMTMPKIAEHMPQAAQVTSCMPTSKEGEKILGGHSAVAVGFNDIMEHFIVRNSWGDKWGDGGYFYIPYNFMTNPDLCADFWFFSKK